MGYETSKRPQAMPTVRETKFASATSGGQNVHWGRINLITVPNTSAGNATASQFKLRGDFKAGDHAYISVLAPATCHATSLVLPATSYAFDGSTGLDGLFFTNAINVGVEIVALTTSRFMAIGATTAMFGAST